MIASGYTLDLYCDREEDHTHGTHSDKSFRWNAEFSAEEKRDCIAEAKRAGWKFNIKKNTCLCPGHASEKKLSTKETE